MKKILSALIITAFFSSTLFASPIAPFRATYVSNWNDVLSITAEAVQELTLLDDGHYEFSFTVNHSLLQLKETSQLGWQQTQVAPLHYEFHQSALGFKRDNAVTFNWQKKQASSQDNNKSSVINLPDNALDRLSYQLQLRADIKAHKKNLSYQIIDKGKLKTYTFHILGSEKLKTPLGTINTVKVEKEHKANDTRVSTFWLAQDWDYLLVKFRQNENGKQYEINIKEATINGSPVGAQP